jgi:hypothetical protein
MRQFKIRPSQIHQIMTEPRTKKEILSKTAITYLETWVKETVYGLSLEFSSKYTEKGKAVENDAIKFYGFHNGWDFVVKNIETFENDFIVGTPDVLPPDGIVYDMKSSWDCFTFPLFDTEIDKKYWMQLQGYMNLTGRTKAKLVYTLQNTPEELERGIPFDYDFLPASMRIKEFSFDYDPEFIASVKERVLVCRDYINNEIMPILRKCEGYY